MVSDFVAPRRGDDARDALLLLLESLEEPRELRAIGPRTYLLAMVVLRRGAAPSFVVQLHNSLPENSVPAYSGGVSIIGIYNSGSGPPTHSDREKIHGIILRTGIGADSRGFRP